MLQFRPLTTGQSRMDDKQQFVSDLWLDRAKGIHTTQDKFNLTALRGGKAKHDAEVALLKNTGLINENTTLLDLACGNGRFAEEFGSTVKWLTATDLCEDFVIFLNQWKDAHHHQNMDFFALDLLEPDYTPYFTQAYSLIFLFGASQIIIKDEDLLSILKNIKKILAPNGHCLIKQTTSVDGNDIHIDKFSEQLQQRWVACYRSVGSIARLCELAGLKVVSCETVYSPTNLGEHYAEVEPWADTKQMMFDVVHG